MMLHIINKSPRNNSCFKECLESCTKESSILFIEDGVYACSSLNNNEYHQVQDKNIKLYALKADLQARGLIELKNHNFSIVDDQGFVELTINHHSSQSWY